MAQIVTGDAVVLDVPAAEFPARMAARLLDMVVQLTALGILLGVVSAAANGLNTAAVIAIVTVVLVLVIIGYPTIFETLSRGKTLGKLALGLRVVADDGGPVRFRQALIRALAGLFEIWTIVLSPVALITSMVSARGKRLGDLFAGTYVIHERVPRRASLPPGLAFVPPPLVGWAARLDLSGLPDQDAAAAASYLRRYHELAPAARDALGLQLATAVAARVSPPPPPGTPPAAYLAAVLAVRRDRDLARFSGVRPAAHSAPAPPTPAAAPGAPPPEPPVPPVHAPPA